MATKKPTPEKLGVGLKTVEVRHLIAETIITAKENFICLLSARNVGKTYTVQKTILESCFLDDYEFLFIVPTKDMKEKGILRKWIEKVARNEFKQYEFKYTTEAAYMRRNENEDWVRVAYCIALTEADRNKLETSPRSRFMIIDEAIVQDDRYVDAFVYWIFTIYQTSDRGEDRIKAIFLGNPMQKINPIFELFGVTVSDLNKPGLVKKGENTLFWYIPKPPDLDEVNSKSSTKEYRFGKMIEGTAYGRMASGYFEENYGFLIQAPPEGFKVYANYGFYFNDETYMQLMEADDGFLYAEVITEEHLKKYCTDIYTTTYHRATEEYPIVPNWLIDTMRLYLDNGHLKFVDEEALLVLTPKFSNYFRIYIT